LKKNFVRLFYVHCNVAATPHYKILLNYLSNAQNHATLSAAIYPSTHRHTFPFNSKITKCIIYTREKMV